MNSSTSMKLERVSNGAAAGTGDVNSDSIDMTGFAHAEFQVHFGAIVASAVTTCKLQDSPDDSVWTDITGASVSVADDDDDKVARLEVIRPLERYVRCVVERATANSTIDSIVALLHGALENPITASADEAGSVVVQGS